MDVVEAIRERRSIRSFRPDPVPQDVLRELLDVSRWAPSGGNAQPWHFAVLGGSALDAVKARLEERVKASWDGRTFRDVHPDLPRTGPYPEALVKRVQSLRERINSSVFPSGEGDPDALMVEYREKSQRFFDAPNAIIIYTDDSSPTVMGAVGIVSQTICLAALHFGLGTCIMGQTIMWPEIYRELLEIPEGKPIATSIAIGYPDMNVPINTFERPREPLEALVDWHGF
jgi:nitroreductase